MTYAYGSSNTGVVTLAVGFAVAMAYVEAVVVVLLRELYYPAGFIFPLRDIPQRILFTEVVREVAAVLMIILVAALCARQFWRRFAFFLIIFGVWDIFYYVWLRVIIGWPTSWGEWDLLFLIPLPWLGPVIAPMTVAVVMVVVGLSIGGLFNRGYDFRPTGLSWMLACLGTVAILYTFMSDYAAVIDYETPHPYNYLLFVVGLVLYVFAYIHSYLRTTRAWLK